MSPPYTAKLNWCHKFGCRFAEFINSFLTSCRSRAFWGLRLSGFFICCKHSTLAIWHCIKNSAKLTTVLWAHSLHWYKMRGNCLKRSTYFVWWKSFSGISREKKWLMSGIWCIMNEALSLTNFIYLQSIIWKPHDPTEWYSRTDQALGWRCGISADEEPLCKSCPPETMIGLILS